MSRIALCGWTRERERDAARTGRKQKNPGAEDGDFGVAKGVGTLVSCLHLLVCDVT